LFWFCAHFSNIEFNFSFAKVGYVVFLLIAAFSKLTLQAPVVLHYLKAPTAVKLTAVGVYCLLIYIMISWEGKHLKIIIYHHLVIYFVMFYTYDVSNRPIPGNIADNE